MVVYKLNFQEIHLSGSNLSLYCSQAYKIRSEKLIQKRYKILAFSCLWEYLKIICNGKKCKKQLSLPTQLPNEF